MVYMAAIVIKPVTDYDGGISGKAGFPFRIVSSSCMAESEAAGLIKIGIFHISNIYALCDIKRDNRIHQMQIFFRMNGCLL